MCFYHDYDWHAEVVEHTESVLTKSTKCMECHRRMKIGTISHHIYQQQYEDYCQQCLAEGDQCTCEEPDYGESYDYDCCQDCHKFLQAVEQAEIESGCRAYEARPCLEGMIEEISNSGRHEAKKYFKMAISLFPELKKSGYLGWLWRKMF